MFGLDISTRKQRAPEPVRRGLARLVRGEQGMSLVETVLASAIFVVVSTVTLATLSSSTTSTRFAKEHTLAEQGATSYIESIKIMAEDPNTYNNIGTVNGNPPGTLPASQPFNGVNGENLGTEATMTTQVVYAASNVPGSYTNGNAYKRVTVTITRNVDGRQLVKLVAFVAPPQRASNATATIIAKVIDYGNNTPVQGATVALGTGPSAPASDVTDSGGKVQFAGLIANPTTGPQAYYDLSVTPPAGYAVLSDTVSPNAAAHVQLSPTQIFNTILDVYRPVTIIVALQNPDTSPYTGNATVTVSSNRGSGTFNYTGSPITITTLNPPSGEPLVPGLSYTVSVTQQQFHSVSSIKTVPTGTYPTSLSSTFTLTMQRQTGTAAVTVQDSNTFCNNAPVTITGGPGSMNLSGSTTSAGGAAQFPSVYVGSGYTVTGKSNVSGNQATLTNQAMGAGTNTFSILLPGTGPC